MKILTVYSKPTDPDKISLDGSFIQINGEGNTKVSNPIYGYIPPSVEFPQVEVDRFGKVIFKENKLPE